MRKTRDLFKKIRVIKGTFHARMDTINDRNGKDLTEQVGIKKLSVFNIYVFYFFAVSYCTD